MDTNFNINLAREETPASDNIIHFNNAGASLIPTPICKALHSYLRAEERLGGYEAAEHYADELDSFYTATAKLLNCSPKEIAYIENATRAWDMAFYSFQFNRGDIILTSLSEYGSNVIAYLQQAKRYGVKIVFIPNDHSGQVDTEALKQLINDKVKLISITHIPTGNGLVNPAEEIGKISKKVGIPYLLDSCQGVGQLQLDVEKLGCDILCATGRKYLRGPRGTGFLYVRENLIEQLEPPMLDQHAAILHSPTEYSIRQDAKRFENWEQYCAGKYALTKAIDYAMSWGLGAIESRIFYLSDYFRKRLNGFDEITVTDEGDKQCGIVTFSSKKLSVNSIQSSLSSRKINVCISKGAGSMIPFHNRGLSEVIRASIHYYNTEREIDYFINSLKSLFSKPYCC